MLSLTKKEFQVYCLLYAFSLDKNLKKQYLVNFALCVDTEMFVRMYNIFENCTEQIRKQIVTTNKNLLSSLNIDKTDAFLDEMRDVFFSDKSYPEIESSVVSILKKILY